MHEFRCHAGQLAPFLSVLVRRVLVATAGSRAGWAVVMQRKYCNDDTYRSGTNWEVSPQPTERQPASIAGPSTGRWCTTAALLATLLALIGMPVVDEWQMLPGQPPLLSHWLFPSTLADRPCDCTVSHWSRAQAGADESSQSGSGREEEEESKIH
jgi:hypothetical protein